eukprot:260650-Chlamydomonas_euryale.AAC.2
MHRCVPEVLGDGGDGNALFLFQPGPVAAGRAVQQSSQRKCVWGGEVGEGEGCGWKSGLLCFVFNFRTLVACSAWEAKGRCLWRAWGTPGRGWERQVEVGNARS